MKILLIGEYSGLHNHLKDGLKELGHEVFLISRGDSFKRMESDFSLDSRYTGFLGRLDTIYFKPLKLIRFLENNDIVQLINPFYFNNKFFPYKIYINYLLSRSKKFFLLGAGDDSYYWKYGRYLLKYGPFNDVLKYDLNGRRHPFDTLKSFKFNKYLLERSNGIIPVMFDYEIGYSNHKKKLKTIPIPINLSKLEYKENVVDGKICILHGLNRYGFKGTKYVEEAFDYLKRKYPFDLELIIEGKLPFNEYLKLMSRANVIIDQTSSYSLGMNGLFAMGMGKVVLSGAEPEALNVLGINDSPVINIQPNAETIIRAIEDLLINKDKIKQLGCESRKYVEKYHNHIEIAKQYISVWSEN
ncbi:MAG: glycosyltransferase [Sediminibacterium sp.]|jgi:glycosyltransferase involved in cell wall biosynthesis|uniref:glycosyltransferase n=1 Tax=Sediminibacterium sp. TaxID=1917865 RepID=UPI002ABA9915|nr:glycosyltransferase [Sediminibacterium sp.]MDZ4070738.1 glycosyltransferase [Sediminibacterium sp.]